MDMTLKRVLLLQFGRTANKDFPEEEGRGYGDKFSEGTTPFFSILDQARVRRVPETYVHHSVRHSMNFDMTDGDRLALHKFVVEADQRNIIIADNVNTIHMTAAALSSIQDKVIVLTGSVLPTEYKNSDADFNLGMAVVAVQYLPPGVYIALYGQVTAWDTFKRYDAH